jgi:tol-pal system protein YbgF
MIWRQARFAAVLVGVLPLGGCLATRQEIEDLRGDIIRLQTALNAQQSAQGEFQTALKDNQDALQGNQADVLAKMGDLNRNLDVVSAHLEESDDRMASLANRLDDLDKNITNRLDTVVKTMQGVKSLPAPSPSRLFTAAQSDYDHRRYDQALTTFQTYLDQYGDTERAPLAQYMIGEIHLAQSNWSDALAAYDAVLADHGKSAYVAAALIRKGQILENQGQSADAIAVYESVLKTYPHRKESQTARQRLAALRSDEPKKAAPAKPKPAAKPKTAPKAAAPKAP